MCAEYDFSLSPRPTSNKGLLAGREGGWTGSWTLDGQEYWFSSLGHILSHAPQRSPSTLKQLALLREYQKQPSYDFGQLLKAVEHAKDEILS